MIKPNELFSHTALAWKAVCMSGKRALVHGRWTRYKLVTLWRHESGEPTCRIYGFWDGDGKGGSQRRVLHAASTGYQAREK